MKGLVSLDEIEDILDPDSEAPYRYAELLATLQKELPRLSKSERETIRLLVNHTCNETADLKACTNSNIYKFRKALSEMIDY